MVSSFLVFRSSFCSSAWRQLTIPKLYLSTKYYYYYYYYFRLQLDLCLSGMVCEGNGILPFLAIFFTTAGLKVKLYRNNFHTTLTAASSGEGVLWQHFHDRSWVYHTAYHIYSISFVSLRSTDIDIMKFGRKSLVKISRAWFGRTARTDGKAGTAFVKLNGIPCTSEGGVKQ
jgi:hypothetical protein